MAERALTQLPLKDSAKLPPRPSIWNARTVWLLLLGVALLWSLGQAGVFTNDDLINEGGLPQLTAFVQAAFQPTLTLDFLQIVWQAALVTLAYAAAATFLSLAIGSLLGVLATEVWWQSLWPGHGHLHQYPYLLMRGLLALPRGIHELLWALLLINILGLDPLVAILAIAIPYGAITGKVFSEVLDTAERRPYLALLSSGVAPTKAFLYALVPVAAADLLSYGFYRFECAIRAAAVLGVVGAGGLGYQILVSMQTLNYNETWTLFYALFLLSGLADWWSSKVRHRLKSDPGAIPDNDRVIRRSLWTAALLVPLSFLILRPEWSLLWSPRTWRLLIDLIAQAVPLNLNWEQISTLFQLSQTTFAMALLAAVMAAAGGWLFSFPAARNILQPGGLLGLRQSWLATAVLILTRYFLLMMRAIPAPIWALVLLFVFFPGIIPGAIALGIYTLGVLGRLMAEVIENTDERPSRAIKAQGASGLQAFFYGLLPPITPQFTAYSLYRWEIAMRATITVGLVGAGGLGLELTQQLSAFNYRGVLAAMIFYIVMTFLVDLISMAVRRTTR